MNELKMRVEEIRNRAIIAAMEPDEWPRIEDAISDLQDYLNNVMATRGNEYMLINETCRRMIISDMLLSFVCSMAGGTSPVVSSAISSFFSVDKKWVGPEDESSAYDLMIISRYDMTNRLNAFEYDELIQFVIGMRYYIVQNGLISSVDDVKMFYDDLVLYLMNGVIMESNEHRLGIFISIMSPIDMTLVENVITLMVDSAIRYIVITCNSIINSTYDHNELGNRKFAVRLFEKQLNDVIKNTFVKFMNDNGVVFNYVSDPHRHTDDMEHDGFAPICDIVLRMIVYGTILSSERIDNSTVLNSVFDAVIIRRGIDNERTNIEYQKAIGGENYDRRIPLQRVRTQYRYLG